MYQEAVEIFGQGFRVFFPLKKVFSPTLWSGLSFSKIVDYPETQLKVSFPKLWITILQTPIGGHHPMYISNPRQQRNIVQQYARIKHPTPNIKMKGLISFAVWSIFLTAVLRSACAGSWLRCIRNTY